MRTDRSPSSHATGRWLYCDTILNKYHTLGWWIMTDQMVCNIVCLSRAHHTGGTMIVPRHSTAGHWTWSSLHVSNTGHICTRTKHNYVWISWFWLFVYFFSFYVIKEQLTNFICFKSSVRHLFTKGYFFCKIFGSQQTCLSFVFYGSNCVCWTADFMTVCKFNSLPLPTAAARLFTVSLAVPQLLHNSWLCHSWLWPWLCHSRGRWWQQAKVDIKASGPLPEGPLSRAGENDFIYSGSRRVFLANVSYF